MGSNEVVEVEIHLHIKKVLNLESPVPRSSCLRRTTTDTAGQVIRRHPFLACCEHCLPRYLGTCLSRSPCIGGAAESGTAKSGTAHLKADSVLSVGVFKVITAFHFIDLETLSDAP